MNSRRIRSFRLAVVLIAAAAALATVAGAATQGVSSMALQQSDLPSGYSQHFSHSIPTVQVRALQGSMVPGYINGWQTELARLQGLRTAAVTSSVLRYRSSAQAHVAFVQTWHQVGKRSGAKPFRAGIGHESRAFSYPSRVLTAYTIMWRYKGVDNVVLAVGLTSQGVTQQFVRQLALEQQGHVRAAIG